MAEQADIFFFGMAEQADTTTFVRWPFTVWVIGAVVTLVYACVVLVSPQRTWCICFTFGEKVQRYLAIMVCEVEVDMSLLAALPNHSVTRLL